jgi:ferredoxin
MRIYVDNEICQGHGRCFAVAPDVFTLDSLGYVALAGEVAVPLELEDQAREGVAACPEGALRFVGER